MFEPRALDTLVHLSAGHPRDLLKNLEQVSVYGDITVELTQTVFSLHYAHHLLHHAQALLANDLPEQLHALQAWPETPDRKVLALQEFYLYLY